MRFLCDNLRAEKIIFEYKLRHLMGLVRYLKCIKFRVCLVLLIFSLPWDKISDFERKNIKFLNTSFTQSFSDFD